MTTKIVEALATLSGLGGSLARSAAALLEAEVEQLRFDLARNWARLLRLVLLAAFVFGAVFWALGALVFAAGAGLAHVLPVWAAALAVAGGLLVLALILSRVVRVRARRLESPVGTVRRRVGSHLDFWRGLLDDEAVRGGTAPGPDEGDEGGTPGGTS
ncbi:MAG: phage holin family protein [Acidobacteriota bacterium]|nr:phage holin family protein [Acidobacteriota bacterium]